MEELFKLNKAYFILIVILLLTSCNSVQKYNQNLQTYLSPQQLREDVDYTQEQLKKFHPNLDWYISQKALENKFDSLKLAIQDSMTPKEFYFHIAPIVSEVRQGHLRVTLPMKRFTRKEKKALKNQKGLLSRLKYYVKDNRIFVLENKDDFGDISVGTEIIEVGNKPVSELLKNYQPLITSDGYNKTFLDYFMAEFWSAAYTAEKGILDSLEIKTQKGNDIKHLYIYRETKTDEFKKQQKEEVKEKSNDNFKDYDITTKSYNRDLVFMGQDSAIAYIKVKKFSGFLSKRFYKESFQEIKDKKVEYLILDVRDNFGGSLAEIHNLYSYLTPEDFVFLKDIEVTKKNSMFHANYFKRTPFWAKPFLAIYSPVYFTKTLFSTKKKGDKFILKNKYAKESESKENAYTGKLYILINGASFSAASVLPSKLKADNRAILVGEETGGANDGTVAGRYTFKELPNSQLMLPIGLMSIQPNIDFTNSQKGVVPDVEIIPMLEDILNKNDVQLDWVLEEIERQRNNKE